MSLYNCSKCGVIENTALGMYWSVVRMQDKAVWTNDNVKFKGLPLCSECAPSEWVDGTKTRWGKWHNRFEKSFKKLGPNS